MVATAVATSADACGDARDQCFPPDNGNSSSTTPFGAGESLHCANSGTYQYDDPRSVCFTFCTSADPSSDATAAIGQTGPASATFIANVTQSTPSAVDMTFTVVTASWSGDFFNFYDTTMTSSADSFHELSRGQPMDGNLEVYVTPSAEDSGPVYASALNCVLLRN